MHLHTPVDLAAGKRRHALRPCGLALSVLLLAGAAQAQTVYCGPGTRVESENGGGVGTIEEIGKESPHFGWYRVSFSWSPRGEWHNPATWKLYPEGTRKVCSPKPPAAAQPGLELPSRPASQAPRPSRPTTPAKAPSDDEDDDDHAEPSVLGSPKPRPEAAPPIEAAGSLPPGRYTCSMEGAGQFPITIVDRSTYSDRGGQSGRYVVNGSQITFETGSLRGQFSRILGQGKFGLSSNQNRRFYGVCNLKR